MAKSKHTPKAVRATAPKARKEHKGEIESVGLNPPGDGSNPRTNLTWEEYGGQVTIEHTHHGVLHRMVGVIHNGQIVDCVGGLNLASSEWRRVQETILEAVRS